MMPKISFIHKSLYIPIFCLVTISMLAIVVNYSNAKLSTNTTTCINGNCTTTICVNDEPCRTFNSNSTNVTSQDQLFQNKTIPPPVIPSEIV
jgi:hypothetical protein